jgi:hypothetical protein
MLGGTFIGKGISIWKELEIALQYHLCINEFEKY